MSDDAPTPRMPPIPPGDWSPTMKMATAPLTPATPRPPGQPRGLNILGTFAHHPDLAAAFCVFNGHILNTSTLTQRQTELAVLRVALVRNSNPVGATMDNRPADTSAALASSTTMAPRLV